MNADLTILTAAKGNAVINTSGYNRKFGAFLEEPT